MKPWACKDCRFSTRSPDGALILCAKAAPIGGNFAIVRPDVFCADFSRRRFWHRMPRQLPAPPPRPEPQAQPAAENEK